MQEEGATEDGWMDGFIGCGQKPERRTENKGNMVFMQLQAGGHRVHAEPQWTQGLREDKQQVDETYGGRSQLEALHAHVHRVFDLGLAGGHGQLGTSGGS